MEKITLFFCDIHGTFTYGNTLDVNADLIKRFVCNLDNIRKINGSDKLLFSFITSEDVKVVLSMENKLVENIMGKDINIGSHFCNVVDKPFEILNYIKYLKESYIINQVYYADDCEFYHFVLRELKLNSDVDCYIQSIIPKDNGIVEVNDTLENILFDFDNKKIKSIH